MCDIILCKNCLNLTITNNYNGNNQYHDKLLKTQSQNRLVIKIYDNLRF